MLTRLQNVFNSKTFVFLLLSISITISSYAATVYRWVDSKGQSHFSSTPPKNTQTERLEIQKTGAQAPALLKSSEHITGTDHNKKAQKDGIENEAEVRHKKSKYTKEESAKYCQQSRELSTRMNGNLQRRVEQPDGSFRKLNESEIKKYKTQAKEGINRYCQ